MDKYIIENFKKLSGITEDTYEHVFGNPSNEYLKYLADVVMGGEAIDYSIFMNKFNVDKDQADIDVIQYANEVDNAIGKDDPFEGKEIKDLYRSKRIAPPKGKGIHTKKFHEIASAIIASGAPKNVAYATAMKYLGRDKAVNPSHRKKEK